MRAWQRKNEEAIAALLRQRGLKALRDLPAGERPRKDVFGLTTHEQSLLRITRKRIDYFQRELARFQPLAFTVYNGPPNTYTSVKLNNPIPTQRAGKVPDVHILPGG